MPRGDGTGPFGTGPMNRRVINQGRGNRDGFARGFGRGIGRCYNNYEEVPRDERELLLERKEILENELKLLKKQLED